MPRAVAGSNLYGSVSMRVCEHRRILGIGVAAMIAFMGVTAPSVVRAQDIDPNRTAQDFDVQDDGDTDWGWLGLLGLAGLLGLRRRDRVEHRVDTTTRPRT